MVGNRAEPEQSLAPRARGDQARPNGAGYRSAIGAGWSGAAVAAGQVAPDGPAPGLANGASSGEGNGAGRAEAAHAGDARVSAGADPLVVSTAARAQARRLIAAANELLDLAAELDQADPATPAGAHSPSPALPGARDPVLEDDGRWLRHARQAYRRRRSRALFFDEGLFGEPAWDLLLDLFIAAKERKRVPVTSACIGAAVPTTTALRWLTILEDRGLILREADPTDARRIFVRLTAEAYAKMVAYFARAATGDGEDGAENGRNWPG